MTQTPRIRVAQPGKSIFSTDIRDFRFDERYGMFKYHSTTNTSVALNAGYTEASATVSHALGYTPAFIAYYKRSDESVWRILPDIPYGVGFDMYPWAYATTTGVTVGYTSAIPYNRITVTGDNSGIREELWTGSAGIIGGNASGSGYSSAIRFWGVPVAKNGSFVSASLEIKDIFSGSSTSDTKVKLYGIDEDNVGTGFDWNYAKTTAVTNRSQNPNSGRWNFSIGVLDQVNEITSRSGWTYGNAMGFIFNDDGSPTNAYIGDDTNSYPELQVTISGTLTVYFRVIIFKDKID